MQCIPHLGATAQHLYVFQRTPSSVDVRANRPTDPAWAASLEPGWQRRRIENFNNLVTGRFDTEDLVNDGWTDIVRNLGMGYKRKAHGELAPAAAMELADFEKMEQVRARVDAIVGDSATAEALKPYYRQFCKRPCFHDEYLDTFNRPTVTLVDTEGRGVERITERGVVVAGVEHEVDCIVYATGFEVGTDFHGLHSRGFPNLIVFADAQSGFTVNFPHMIDERSRHTAYLLGEAFARGVDTFETSQEAEDAWVAMVVENARMGERYLEACTPGYYNNEGKPHLRSRRNTSIDALKFVETLEGWRADGGLPGLEVTYRAS